MINDLLIVCSAGPDHMTVFFSTAQEVYFVDSSLGHLEATEDPSHTHGTTYFVYYSHGTRTVPWEFWVDFKVCLIVLYQMYSCWF